MACPVPKELMDDDWNWIIHEFNMNYTDESIRNGYQEEKKKEAQKVDNDLMRELGYTDEDILNKRD